MSSSSRDRIVPWALFLGVFASILVLAFWGLGRRAVHAEKAVAGEMKEGVLAKVGDTEVLATEVEAKVSADLMRIKRERHEAMAKGLETVVRERLFELEASSRGITVDELLEAEVGSKVAAVDDAQVDAFQGAALSETLIGTLRTKYAVESFLEPLRIGVASEGFPQKGNADAPVTIVEFSDFECPYCSRVLPSLRQVMDEYSDSVRVVFRQFPLNSIHPRAQKAAEASLCANEQGKFWEIHDAMFEEQKSLAVDQLKEKAARLGLDTEAFDSCLDQGRFSEQVATDIRDGSAVGVSGTPAFFINGRFVNGAVPYETLAAIVDEELERAASDS